MEFDNIDHIAIELYSSRTISSYFLDTKRYNFAYKRDYYVGLHRSSIHIVIACELWNDTGSHKYIQQEVSKHLILVTDEFLTTLWWIFEIFRMNFFFISSFKSKIMIHYEQYSVFHLSFPYNINWIWVWQTCLLYWTFRWNSNSEYHKQTWNSSMEW